MHHDEAVTVNPADLAATTDPNLKSWLESANADATDFPIQNLPLVVYAKSDEKHSGGTHTHDDGTVCDHDHSVPALGIAIGDQVVDLMTLLDAGIFNEDGQVDPPEDIIMALEDYSFNALAMLGRATHQRLRIAVSKFLRDGTPGGQQGRRLRQKAISPLAGTTLLPPVVIPDYTDFYASIHHATTVGSMFRPDNPLLPNYKHVPIGYHGRASSIVVSGTDIRRPRGQQSPPDDKPGAAPTFGPSTMLDYELELGLVVGAANPQGQPIPIEYAREHMLGLVLVNDWSARDVQKWEYQPLGPFLAKNFATSISPFIVTLDALEPFRCPAYARPAGDPTPLPYLFDETDQRSGGFDITLEVLLQTEKMRAANIAPVRLSRGSFTDMYWTFAQLLTHHTSNGCNMNPGDLLASGTISGSSPDSRGCMLELTWDGRDESGKPKPRKPVELPTGEKRTFLQDGDEVIIRGYAQRSGARRIGLGECRGRILPAIN